MLVSADTVAQRLGVSSRTVRRWAREGRLPHYPLGPKCLKFDEGEISGLLEMVKRNGSLAPGDGGEAEA